MVEPRTRRRHSIGVQLPLIAGGLVLFAVAVLSTASYLAVRQNTVGVATTRLQGVTNQLADLSSQSAAGLRTDLTAQAANPVLATLLADTTAAAREPARTLIGGSMRTRDQVLATEVRDSTGRRVLAAGEVADRIAATAATQRFPRPGAGSAAATGPLLQVGDSLVYPVVARIPGAAPGYLIQWRLLVTSPKAREQIGKLIGGDARFSFGNVDGSAWTDFSGTVPPPPVASSRLRGVLTFTRPDRGEVLADAAAVEGTPWLVVVEFPAREIFAPVNAFLRTIAVIAVLCLAVGLLAAWFLSRQITKPLGALTAAADAIAAGDLARRAHLGPRRDEFGVLGDSFDKMATQAEEARRELEQKVKARTRELYQALERLQDTQESLVRREKLALLGHLASGVGHELRNPLGVMSNAVFYLEMVLEGAPDNVREYLGILRQQIALSGKIVNDLLDFSRTNPAQRQVVVVEQMALAQLARLGPFTGVTVQTEFPESLPAVHVDPVHAAQVVMNLVTNAIQAMGNDGGTLALRGRRNGGNVVILEVSDTGPGVPPENHERIFEPLFTTKARGIGLGLAVSRSLAKANGGDLAVVIASGRGATFAFTMPVVPEPT